MPQPEWIYTPPQTEITLAKAEEGDKKIWLLNSPEEVVDRINVCQTRLITFKRVQGIGNPSVQFSTRPDNIVNVRDIRNA